MATMRFSALILICLFAFSGACTREDSPQIETVTIAPYKLTLADSIDGPYVECDEATAEFVLEVFVTVPKVITLYPFRIPYCRVENYRDEGHQIGRVRFCTSGPDGGLSGSVGIESSTEESLSVRVDLFWSKPWTKRDISGNLDELIEIPVGKAGMKRLPDGRYIGWRFDTPQPSTPSP